MKTAACFFICILIIFTAGCSHPGDEKTFLLIPSSYSGITFNNQITESDSLNPIDVTNIYNGGGVGIGDFNNDGLQDIYFTGSMVANKLYLNKGKLRFEDITDKAGVNGSQRWCRGVAVVDINNDGLMDMYICASMNSDAEKRRNILYINKGIDKQGIPHFEDLAAEYGLDDTTYSTMASFFDYDNDGDLDVYIVVNEILTTVNPSEFKPKITDGSFPSTGRLYQNNMNKTLGHPVFTNVTKQAGLTIEGYGHGVNVADINNDGWKDIFVTNDFVSTDLLYINNHDGTFTDKAALYFKHTSANGMGQDVTDINNDGLTDIVELDMNPEDNYRKKMMLNPGNYPTFQLADFFKYQYQYVRNTLQVNQGPRVNANDSVGDPIFSDAGYFSGIAETDWSWAPLVADFDNDGLRDIIVTNGFPKDITDHDFIAFRQEPSPIASKAYTLAQIPQVKLHKYAFKNKGNCQFTDVSANWGLQNASFSNGAAYADLDNDGDLDMVVNNINDEASVYENTGNNKPALQKHYLSIHLEGDSLNMNGLGTWIDIYYGGNHQAYEQNPYRGYLSTIQIEPHFGLDTFSIVDSIIIKWPTGNRQLIKHVAADQTLKVNKKDAADKYVWTQPVLAANTMFKDVTGALGITYNHSQEDYNDFSIQKLLPHKLSEYGPSLAAGDVNGDGLDDIVVGGNSSYPATVLLQSVNGLFTQKALTQPVRGDIYQDMGIILFDADGDGDLDVYIARGGYASTPNAAVYGDKFLVNDGKGNFTIDTLAFPKNFASKSCVKAIDYDHDGDLDLFVAGRVEPWKYPKAVSSFIYRNDSQKGHAKFTDVTSQVAPQLNSVGLVCDALFTDFDNDGWADLVLAGEWMPLTFLKNYNGIFKNVTANTGLTNSTGWWNSLAAGDFDNDGDIDYIVGNLGQNSFFKAAVETPVSIYAKDFDNNGSYDAIISSYLPVSQDTITKKEFPVPARDALLKQIIGFRSKFPDYKSYAHATVKEMFSEEQVKDALILRANNFSSSFCRNDGGGKFTLMPLPFTAQLSALNGMIVDDVDGDNNLDIIINTNDYGTDVTIGRYDALNGLVLKGDGKGGFTPQTIMESGVFIPGNGKALVKLRGKNGNYLAAATQNRGPLKVFSLKKDVTNIPLLADDEAVIVYYKNGKKQKQECYYGNSFLSQSARFLRINKNVDSVVLLKNSGIKRTLHLNK